MRRALAHFVRAFENTFRVSITTDTARIPFGRPELAGLASLATRLRACGIPITIREARNLPDEPRMRLWSIPFEETTAAGASLSSDVNALTAALAEALERALWLHEDDYFAAPKTARSHELTHRIEPARFCSFVRPDTLQRYADAHYLWIRGYSWTDRASVHVPAQVVSRAHAARARDEKLEPIIRPIITTGLATGQTREAAVLAGALEVIERDAFMLMWYNQLSLPRIRPADLCAEKSPLSELLTACARYRLKVDFIKLITDAPAHCICAVVRDETLVVPVSTGLAAHADASRAAEKALLEALRARVSTRQRLHAHADGFNKSPKELKHGERGAYWTQGDRHRMLDFLTAGPEVPLDAPPYPPDAAHLEEIIEWCRKKSYAFVSVDFSRSRKNATPWSIEFVLIPELQPMSVEEQHLVSTGTRLRDVPTQFGYAPRATPFTEEPHPFI